MTNRELMQQALDALEAMQSYAAAEKKGLRICDEAIEALRARLEKWTARDTAYRPGGLPQAEQELVAWSRVNMNDHKEGDLGIGTVKWDASAPLVVHPHPAFQATQPQQHSEQWWRHEVSNAYANGYEKGRASVKQPEQEPVATLFGSLPVYDVSPKRRKPPTQDLSAPLTVNGVPMYPQREWQTLTDEEMFSLWVRCPAETEDRFAFARAIEAKLKEKNG